MDSAKEVVREVGLEAVEVDLEEDSVNKTKDHQLLSSLTELSYIDAKTNSLSSALTWQGFPSSTEASTSKISQKSAPLIKFSVQSATFISVSSQPKASIQHLSSPTKSYTSTQKTYCKLID